ncbi:MAG TPA: MarR family transcriptional regulator [Chloroflexaceae bacterium]|nr:MarR family transcriptional regulator [Chloroflexaceae bacterium]
MDRRQIDLIAEELLSVVPKLHRMVASDVRREDGSQASVLQLRLLATLLQGPQSMSALARQQQVSPQAVCDLVHDMVGRGWLTRVPHPNDRRKQLLRITDPGRAACAAARERALRQLAPRLHTLSDTELHVLAAALPTLQRVLSQGDRNGHAEGERIERSDPDEP